MSAMMVNAKRSVNDRHPLDPLNTQEIIAAVQTLRSYHDLGPGMRFETIVLAEPTAEALNRHQAGEPVERIAFLAVYDTGSGDLYEARISLDHGTILDWKPRPGARPRIAGEEFLLAEEILKRDPDFQAALARRNITDLSLVCVDPWSAGVFGFPEELGRRVVLALTWVRSRPFDNQFAHPVEGLSAIVDINQGRVVRIDDFGIVPVPQEEANYAARFRTSWRSDLKPIEVRQPEGPSFTVRGNEIVWCGWRLRVGFTPREGLVLHNIEIKDNNRFRSIIRRASLAEMVVPYGSPFGVHPRKNAFDCGEYGIGMLANSLNLGCDCLGTIHYLDATVSQVNGEPRKIPNAICIHEEDAGLLWKHYDFRTGETDTRRNRRLVISFIATVGNYEYAFYWYFYLDGTIQHEVKLTGIINTAGIPSHEAEAYGTVVSPGVLGHIHQHLFNVRLDMAIDGPNNSVTEVDFLPEPHGPKNPYGNAFRPVERVLKTESEAHRRADADVLRYWKIINPGVKNRYGEPVAYRLLPQSAIKAFAAPGSQLAKRGGFVQYHLWVTPTRDDERWPAGDYVNQSEEGQGLPRWVLADRPVANTRLTVWHTFGHHHLPRPEDFPVQPVATCGFTLQPFGFFEQNPTLDVPPPRDQSSCCA
jgi:primary-amine oxidase